MSLIGSHLSGRRVSSQNCDVKKCQNLTAFAPQTTRNPFICDNRETVSGREWSGAILDRVRPSGIRQMLVVDSNMAAAWYIVQFESFDECGAADSSPIRDRCSCWQNGAEGRQQVSAGPQDRLRIVRFDLPRWVPLQILLDWYRSGFRVRCIPFVNNGYCHRGVPATRRIGCTTISVVEEFAVCVTNLICLRNYVRWEGSDCSITVTITDQFFYIIIWLEMCHYLLKVCSLPNLA